MQSLLNYNDVFSESPGCAACSPGKQNDLGNYAENYGSALRVLKGDYKLSKEINAGKCRMPERIRSYLHSVVGVYYSCYRCPGRGRGLLLFSPDEFAFAA